MTLVRFQYITKDRDRHGNLRFYFRRPGKPKIRLHGLPGSEEFLAGYKAALAESRGVKSEKSFEWLCNRYYKSTRFGGLDDSTQRRKRTVLDEICNMVGERGRRLGLAPYASLKKVHVRKLRDMKSDTPGSGQFPPEAVFGAVQLGDQKRPGDRQPGGKAGETRRRLRGLLHLDG